MESIRGAVRDAVVLCRRVQEEYLIANTKVSGEGKEPVTIADYGSQAIICRALESALSGGRRGLGGIGRAIP